MLTVGVNMSVSYCDLHMGLLLVVSLDRTTVLLFLFFTLYISGGREREYGDRSLPSMSLIPFWETDPFPLSAVSPLSYVQ